MSSEKQGQSIVFCTALEEYCASVPDVILAYLFGSHARGQAGPLSDIDVAVLVDTTVCEDDYFDVRVQLIRYST